MSDFHMIEFEVRDLRNKEWFVVDDAYLNGWARKCGVYATAVYFVLCRHASTQTQTCFPSVGLIAGKLNISDRQVTRALRILEAHNIIKIEVQTGRKNLYYLLDKKHWSTPDCQSPLTNSHHTPDCQSGQPLTVSPTKYMKLSIRKKDMSESPDLDHSFSLFYKAYPKHEGKQPAVKAWKKLHPENGTVELILSSLERQKTHKEQLKKSGQFCPEWPYPATWLNDRRWEDEIPVFQGDTDAAAKGYFANAGGAV